MSQGFAEWACDPSRPLEERFGAELMIEGLIHLFYRKHQIPGIWKGFDELSEMRRERKLNPAYVPHIYPGLAEQVQEILGEATRLNISTAYDRPLRDLEMLRFCPELEVLDLEGDFRDLRPLLALEKLTSLSLKIHKATDLRVVAQLTGLKKLQLWFHVPWPDLRGLENLRQLEEFTLLGNLLVLEAVPELPSVRAAQFDPWIQRLPLREVGQLPAMPELRTLSVKGTASLAGIERYWQLINLEAHGIFEDLAPLAALKRLTHLTLEGEEFSDVRPLAGLPELRRVLVRAEEPRDYMPLADLPRLHTLAVKNCPTIETEVNTLNALLEPWSVEFALPEPRPVPPLRMLVKDWPRDSTTQDSPAESRPWGEDLEMPRSESDWFEGEAYRRLVKLLGPEWSREIARIHCCSGRLHITLMRMEDIDRMAEVVAVLRGMIAEARYFWDCIIMVNSLAWYERDIDEIVGPKDPDEFDEEARRRDWNDYKQRQRERQEFLERKYRLQLRQELGAPIRPEDFAQPAPKRADDDGPEEEEGDLVEAGDNDEEEVEEEFGDKPDLSLYVRVTLTTLYVREDEVPLARMLMSMNPEA